MKSSEHKSTTGASRSQDKNKSTFFAKKEGDNAAQAKESSHSSPVQTKSPSTPFFNNGNTIQPKLEIHPSDDVYEKEADAVAEKVMQHEHAPPSAPETPPDTNNSNNNNNGGGKVQTTPL